MELSIKYIKKLNFQKKIIVDIGGFLEKNKTYLVTGGTGFIGSNICNMLLKEGFNVNIFDNNFRGKFKRIDTKNKKKF